MSNKVEEGRGRFARFVGERGVVPRLRFAEFLESWAESKLGYSTKLFSGLHLSPDDYGSSGLVPYFTGPSDFTNDVIDFEKWTNKTANCAIKHDVLITVKGSGVGELWYLQLPSVAMGRQLMAIRSVSCSSYFLFQYLKTQKSRFEALGSGNLIPGLSRGDILDLMLPTPSLEEQQKIATCLSYLDDLITTETQKLDTLKAHKKGLMQQLFPAEGETVPRLRFAEFRGAGEWVTRRLGDFITERNQSPMGNVPLFSLTIEDGVTPKTERYERSFLVKDENEAYKLVLPDDFAYNPMNLRFGAIGRHSGAGNVAVSKYYNIFFCDKTVDSRFCEIYFKSDEMVGFYDNMATGSLIEKRRVHFNDFLKFNIRFPLLSEQQKIASCLSSLDDLITAQTQKLAALKTHKKGLMQQLFPSPDEPQR